MKVSFPLGLVVLALALVRTDAVRANNTMLDATDQVCDDVKKYLDSEGKNKVRIGQFIGKGPEALRASASPLLREALKISLGKKKVVVVEEDAHFEMTGSYQAIEDAESGRQAVLLSVTLDDLKGNERKFQGAAKGKRAEKYFFGNVPDVAKVLGINTYQPPGRTEKEQIADLKKDVDQPQSPTDGARILAAKDAPFAIEVLVAAEKYKHAPEDYQARTPTDKKGLAFVPIQRGEAYGVRLHNLSDYDVAVDLRLDGINMYHFSAKRDKHGNPAYRYVVVAPRSAVVVRGWFVSLNDSDEFLVVPREKSVFAQLSASNPAEVGVITALFHRAWDRKKGLFR